MKLIPEHKEATDALRQLISTDRADTTYNSKWVQLLNLEAFLEELGYTLSLEDYHPEFHVKNMDTGNGNPDYISFDLAVSLFNGVPHMLMSGWVQTLCDSLRFTHQEFDNAHATKCIETIKLQRSKKEVNGVQCQSHLVKFI